MRIPVTFSPLLSTRMVCEEVNISTLGRLLGFLLQDTVGFQCVGKLKDGYFLADACQINGGFYAGVPPPMTATCLP